MTNIGIIGWRGMVGSVLLERMRAERDFDLVEPTFFSTSQAGGAAPDIGRGATRKSAAPVQDANDIAALARQPRVVQAQESQALLRLDRRSRECARHRLRQ